MKIIAELSLYPLTEEYGNAVITFINELKSVPNLQIRTNSMSTQIVGEWDQVMLAIKGSLQAIDKANITSSLVMKIITQPLEMEWIEVS